MKFILNKDKLTMEQQDDEELNSGSIKYYEADVEYDESWNNLIIEGIIAELEGSCYADEGISIPVSLEGKIYIDRELSGQYGIGFKGYTLEFYKTEDTEIDTEKTYYIRTGEEGSYSYIEVENPNVEDIDTYYEAIKDYQISTGFYPLWYPKGAGQIVTQKDEVPKPSKWEAYVSQIQNILKAMQVVVDEADTIDFDVSKEGLVTSIVLTKKDGTTKTVQVLDGKDGEKRR